MAEGAVDIKFDVMGETVIARQLQVVDEFSRDMREPLGQLMDMLLESVRLQFDTEGAASDGAPWQPLSDIYGKWKAMHYPGAPILVRDGGMREAMLNVDTAITVGPTEAVYHPISDIAGYHQQGADWMGPAWGHGDYPHHLPARPMVDLSDEFKHEAVDRTFARWLAEKLAEARRESGDLGGGVLVG